MLGIPNLGRVGAGSKEGVFSFNITATGETALRGFGGMLCCVMSVCLWKPRPHLEVVQAAVQQTHELGPQPFCGTVPIPGSGRRGWSVFITGRGDTAVISWHIIVHRELPPSPQHLLSWWTFSLSATNVILNHKLGSCPHPDSINMCNPEQRTGEKTKAPES